MTGSQSLRSLLSYSMIGSLYVQRLGMELLITVSVLLAPMGFQERAIAGQYLPNSNQFCLDRMMIQAIVIDDHLTEQM